MTEAGLDAHLDDAVNLLVGDRFGQTEAWNLGPHHAAALGVAVEHHAVVTERQQIAGDGQGGRAGADQRDTLAVLLLGYRRQKAADVALVVGSNALQPTDRDRFLLDPAAPAGRLARTVAGAAENAW